MHKFPLFFIGLLIASNVSSASNLSSAIPASTTAVTLPPKQKGNAPLQIAAQANSDTYTRILPNDANAANCSTPLTGGTITLMQAVESAFCHNPQARQAWVNTQASNARVGIARAAFFPTITASANRTRDEQKITYANDYSSSESFTSVGKNITLNAVLFDFGVRYADLTAAQQLLIAAVAEQDLTLQKLFEATAEAYNSALIAQANARSTQSAKQAAQEIFKATYSRQMHGIGSKSDMLNAQTNLTRTSHDEIKAKSEAVISMGMLANIMGLAAKTKFTLTANELNGLPDQSMRQAQLLIEDAQNTHPSIVQARAQLAAAQAKVKSAIASGLPTLSLNAGRYLNGRPGTSLSSNQSTENLYGLTLTVPLFEGFGHIYRVKEARAQAASRQIELERTELNVDIEIWRSFQELKTAYANLISTNLITRNTRLVLQAALTRYNSGAADVLEWIRARTDFTNAEQEQTRARIDWRTAYLKFLSTLGKAGFWALDETTCCKKSSP